MEKLIKRLIFSKNNKEPELLKFDNIGTMNVRYKKIKYKELFLVYIYRLNNEEIYVAIYDYPSRDFYDELVISNPLFKITDIIDLVLKWIKDKDVFLIDLYKDFIQK